MNAPPDSLNDDLRRWRVSPPTDPDFRQKVWRRIGDQSRSSWPAYLRARAATWTLVAALALAAAAYTGSAVARAHVRSDRETMVASYLVDLDPRLQAVRRPATP